MAVDHITSILSEDYAHFEQHCMSHPVEAEPVFDCVMELRTALTAFRLATDASKRESSPLSPVVFPGGGLLPPAESSEAIAPESSNLPPADSSEGLLPPATLLPRTESSEAPSGPANVNPE